jgi:TRAP-type C4-dicarboxylate transport system substrate-binding protein
MPYFTALEHFTYFSPLMASPKLMKKLDANQKKAVIRAGKEANDYQKAVMSKKVGEIRKFLTTEGQGGMKTTEFDRTDFIAAGQRVQDKYATSKGAEFTAFVNAIRAAAN